MMIFDHVFYHYSRVIGHALQGKVRDTIAAVLLVIPLSMLIAFCIFLESWSVNSFFLKHFNLWVFGSWAVLLLLSLLRYVIYPASYLERAEEIATRQSAWGRLFTVLYTLIIVLVIWLIYLFVRDYRAQ